MEQDQGLRIEELLYGGLSEVLNPEEFERRATALEEKAFSKVISDTYEGRIRWRRDLGESERYTAEAYVENVAGSEVTIPVLFYTDIIGEGSVKVGYLHLGDEEGPVRNTADDRVRELARNYFKIQEV